MKKILLGAAAVVAASAMTGVAAADTADVGVHIGNIEADASGDADFWGLSGAYSHQMDGGLVLQLDGQHDSIDLGADLGFSYGAVNLGMRNDSHALYGFAGLADWAALSVIGGGVGGQLYLGNFTVNGSVGFASSDDADLDVTVVNVDGTYFFTDNFGLTGQARFGDTEIGGAESEVTTLGLGAAWRITGSNFTLNGGYQSIDGDFDEGDAWRFGVTYNIGTGSERERSQSGASFNGARNLYEETVNVLVF
jgi:hypothetical protein